MLKTQRKQVTEAQRAAESWPNPDLVFPTSTGELYDRTNERRIEAICRAAEVSELGANAMRHTVLTWHAHNGTPIAQTQALAGHSKPTTTMQHYVAAGEVRP